MELYLGIAVLVAVLALIGLQFRPKASQGIGMEEYERMKADLDRKTSEMAKLQQEKDEQAVKGKVLYDNYKNTESDLKVVRQERDALLKQVQAFEASQERKEAEFTERISKLETAKEKLEQEQKRVIKEEEEDRAAAEAERDRLWNDHENSVISILTDLCKQPQFAFTAYTNNSVPEGFDGSLKPDFMIEFLGQYVIFDAKVSKAKSMQTYVNDQVKKTVEKVKNNESIYKWIFLVIPATALGELKQHHYPVDGYHVFVVSPEAIPAILATFKHITRYEFAEQMDPQQRENIVQHIAELDFHINLRNAADIMMSKMGADLISKTQKVDPALAEEVALKKAPMNAKASLSAADIKKLVANLTAQNMEMQELTSPKAAITKEDMHVVQEALEESL